MMTKLKRKMDKKKKTEKKEKKENLLLNIIFNIVLPVIILSKLTAEDKLGPIYGLVVALAFPTLYFLYDLASQKKFNFLSIVGFVGIFLTGIIGVFKFPSEWIAVKEAAVPMLIGIAVLVSLKTPYPLVKKLIYNDTLLDTERIENKLNENGNYDKFEKTLVYSTYMLAGSFLLSSVLNFALAKYLIHSPTGTEEFSQELAKMTGLSYPVIALPSTLVMLIALFYLIKKTSKLTGFEFEELLAENLREENK